MIMNRSFSSYDPRSSRPIYQDPVYYNHSMPNQTYQSDYYQNEQVHQQTPFEYYAKPTQPENWPFGTPSQQQQSYYQSQQQDPYFYQQQPQQPSTTAGILAQFQTAEGQMDVQKMLSTVGQLANTVQQVSPVIKEIGAMIRVFR